MQQRSMLLAVVGLGLLACLAAACAASDAAPSEVVQAIDPTPAPANADSTEGAGSGVAFPPPRNIQEFPQLELGVGDQLATAFAHRLAPGLLTDLDVQQLFRGRWIPVHARVIEADEIQDTTCDDAGMVTSVGSTGIDLIYESTESRPLRLYLRQGSDVGLVLQDVRASVDCIDAAGTASIVSADLVTGADDQIVVTVTHNESFGDVSSTFVAATAGDRLVAASSLALPEDTATNEQELLAAVALMLKRLE